MSNTVNFMAGNWDKYCHNNKITLQRAPPKFLWYFEQSVSHFKK